MVKQLCIKVAQALIVTLSAAPLGECAGTWLNVRPFHPGVRARERSLRRAHYFVNFGTRQRCGLTRRRKVRWPEGPEHEHRQVRKEVSGL